MPLRTPLAEALTRYTAASPHRDAGVGRASGEGWTRAADLLDPEGHRLAAHIKTLSDRYGIPPHVAALWTAGDLVGAVAGPAIAVYVAERRVPLTRTDEVTVHTDADGWFDRVAFAKPRMAVLPTDPAVMTSKVTVVDDLPALRQRLADELMGFCEPVVGAVRRQARLGPRTLWGYIADMVGSGFLRAGRIAGAQPAAAVEADALFALADPVLQVRLRWVPIVHRDVAHVFMVRGQCCMAYKAPDHGYCTSCPFTTDDERECRLRSWLDAQPVPGATT